MAAEAEHRRRLLTAEAEGKSQAMIGEGEGKRVALEGEAHAEVLRPKVAAYGDPRLYALSLMARHISHSQRPLVPDKLFMSGGGTNGDRPMTEKGVLGTLLDLMLADRMGFDPFGNQLKETTSQSLADPPT